MKKLPKINVSRLMLMITMFPVLGLIALSPNIVQATPSEATAKGMIVFFSAKTGDSEIWLMNPDGSGLSRLTDRPNTADQLPVWSPDAKRIAWTSIRSISKDQIDPNIYVMNADGTNQTRYTSSLALDSLAVWSPDGKRLAWTSNRNDNNFEIYMMYGDGRAMRTESGLEIMRLTTSPKNEGYVNWSPDGKQILFSLAKDDAANLYLVNAEGGSPKVITGGNPKFMGSFSPDGKKITFSTPDGNAFQIGVMDANGKNLKVLTKGKVNSLYPSWSPDGKQLVYMQDQNKKRSIWVISADGGTPKQISPKDMDAQYPNWSRVQPPIKLPIAKPIAPQKGCPIVKDKTYGYTPENPITVGAGDFFSGPSNERALLDVLRGPKGEVLTYERTNSEPSPITDHLTLDRYEITYKGLKKPIYLYIDMYSEIEPRVPVGLTCGNPASTTSG